MTSNQNQRAALEEQQRANQAKEREENRSNVEKEKETNRSNRQKEIETKRSNKANEELTSRGQNISTVNSGIKGLGTLFSAAIKALNDPSWYNSNPQLVKDAASFAFAAPLGMTEENVTDINVVPNSSGPIVQVREDNTIPGICALKYVASIPNEQLMRTISDKYYAFIRHANSGSRNYESNDLMMYFLAATECYSQIAFAAKLYSIALTYKRENTYYARGILRAIGCSDNFINDLMGDLSNYRMRLNRLIARINSFYIPNNFTLFQRKVWLNSVIVKDHEIKRSSLYTFVPAVMLTYAETSSNLRLDATTMAFTGATNAYANYLQQLENMVDQVFQSEDLGIMSGDIYKAYKDSGLFIMNSIPENYHIEEFYSNEVLSQINSATLNGPIDTLYAGIYTTSRTGLALLRQGYYADNYNQAANRLRVQLPSTSSATATHLVDLASTPSNISGTATQDATQNQFLVNDRAVINMYKDDVTPDDVMVASRLISCNEIMFTGYSSTSKAKVITECGSEILTTATFCMFNKTNNSFDLLQNVSDGFAIYPYMFAANNTVGFANCSSIFEAITRIQKFCSSFDWCPRIRITYGSGFEYQGTTSSGTTVTFTIPLPIVYDNFDFANYMTIQKINISKLHTVALMSEFDV